MSDVRKDIIATYAEWTAMSALRSGAPIKSRRDIYTALRGVDFDVLLADELGPINRATFDAWHADAVRRLVEREPRLTVGWSAKIINVYLKTRVYIGAQGRHHIKEMIHPPIDAGLWIGLSRRFQDRPDILERTNCVNRIKDIVDYECYRRIIFNENNKASGLMRLRHALAVSTLVCNLEAVRYSRSGKVKHGFGSLAGAWCGTAVYVVGDMSARPDEFGIQTSTPEEPERTLFDLARAEYENITAAAIAMLCAGIEGFAEVMAEQAAETGSPYDFVQLANVALLANSAEMARALETTFGGGWKKKYTELWPKYGS